MAAGQSPKLAQRAEDISPFHVMDVLAQAKAMEAAGRRVIHLEVGEPDFKSPEPIIEAGMAALKKGYTHYTPALGLPELREAIANWYHTRYSVEISPARVVVTPGASGALLLVMGALLERDKKIMLADPGYPCNRHFARFIEAQAQSIEVGADTDYQLTGDLIKQYWTPDTRLALVASPANPTGAVLDRNQLASLVAATDQQGGQLIVDETYHGLTYDGVVAPSALEVNSDTIVINSFSKYFGMTGWRLGWLIAPESMIPALDRLAQNLFLAASTMSQYAALAAFQPDTLAILEQRRAAFESRRNSLLPGLRELGFELSTTPQGAFYLYADVSKLIEGRWSDSQAFTQYLLSEAGVAVTPGLDFGDYRAKEHIRFAYTVDEAKLSQALEALQKVLK